MRGILKNTLLLLGGMALGSLATRRAIRYAVENRYDRVKYEEPIFGTGVDAELVLDQLESAIANYGIASVADLYDLAGITCRNYTANRYGWTDIQSAKVIRTREGYTLQLPRTVQIN